MSPILSSRPKAMTLNVVERTKDVLSPLNLHWAGVALLGLVNLYFLIHMGIAWRQASGQDADAVAAQRVQLKTAQIAAKPLQGLDVKLKNASSQADQFSLERLPLNYSEVATEMGVLVKRSNVHLTRVQYAQSAVDGDAAGQLTQVMMDAGLSGDYRSLVTFINSLERDKVFFLISGVSLTGQQTGQVNLRIRIVTYLRGLGSPDEMAKLQMVPASAKATTDEPVGGGAR
jgi:type IV pilus assembly protein PilO